MKRPPVTLRRVSPRPPGLQTYIACVHVLDGMPVTYHVLPDTAADTCGEAYCAACADLPMHALIPELRAIDGYLEGGPDAAELERWLSTSAAVAKRTGKRGKAD